MLLPLLVERNARNTRSPGSAWFEILWCKQLKRGHAIRWAHRVSDVHRLVRITPPVCRPTLFAQLSERTQLSIIRRGFCSVDCRTVTASFVRCHTLSFSTPYRDCCELHRGPVDIMHNGATIGNPRNHLASQWGHWMKLHVPVTKDAYPKACILCICLVILLQWPMHVCIPECLHLRSWQGKIQTRLTTDDVGILWRNCYATTDSASFSQERSKVLDHLRRVIDCLIGIIITMKAESVVA
jgi:hypothetical protein